MGAANPQELLEHLMQADEFGVKLEVVQGSYSWEFFPSPLHQAILGDIAQSLRRGANSDSGCGCFSIMDAYIKFPDGSLKRPDLMIYCERPQVTREALRVVPEAVVEVLSPGSERKDLDVGPPFYLSQGVRDVVVVNPEAGAVLHFTKEGVARHASPAAIRLACGCELTA